MSITAEFPYQCPVCKDAHAREGLVVGLAIIACPKVEPTGATFFYPKYGVIVVGAGLGVNEKPEKEKSVDELRAEVAQAEAAAKAKPTADVEAEKARLKSRLAQLKGGA